MGAVPFEIDFNKISNVHTMEDMMKEMEDVDKTEKDITKVEVKMEIKEDK